jgi:peroxiredoxin
MFTLPDATGSAQSLESMLTKGPVVVTFYRGGWCPYCNLQLREYQLALADMQGLGAQLVAISPQTPDESLSTAEKSELKFHVLSDARNDVARQFGLAYKLPEKVAEAYASLNLDKVNGGTSDELPMTATYVIDQSGTIAYAFIEADYRARAEPADIIDALRQLKRPKP